MYIYFLKQQEVHTIYTIYNSISTISITSYYIYYVLLYNNNSIGVLVYTSIAYKLLPTTSTSTSYHYHYNHYNIHRSSS